MVFPFLTGYCFVSQKVHEWLFAHREAKIAVSASLTDQSLAVQAVDPGVHLGRDGKMQAVDQGAMLGRDCY